MNTLGTEVEGTSPLTIPISLEDAKKILSFNNKMLSKSKNFKAQEFWKFWENNLDELARNFVKARAKGVLEDEWEETKPS